MGLALLATSFMPLSAASDEDMPYTRLSNDISLPLVGLGTSRLLGQDCQNAVTAAIDAGYRLTDTAQMYQNEADVGIAVKQAIASKKLKREEIFITTKLSSNMTFQQTLQSTKESLKRLQLDYLDVLLIHAPYQNSKEMYQAMEQLHKQGLIKTLGISNFNVERYNDFIKDCEIIPAINQCETHVFFQRRDLSKAMGERTKLEAWSPFVNGRNNFFTNETLVKIAQKHNKSVAQVGLRFLIEHDIIVIPKSRNAERIRENINIFDFKLDEADKKMIYALDTNHSAFGWGS